MNQNKITNLKRVGFKNKITILSYLYKSVLGLKKTQKENDLYFLYMHLITSNGSILSEANEYYEIDFKNEINNNIKLRKNPSSDLLVFNQIFGYKEYEKVVEIYDKEFGEKDLKKINIIDLGANIGMASLYFNLKYKNTFIIAVEPEIGNFNILSANLSKYQNIVKLNVGIWHRDAKLKIVNNFRDQSDWAFRVEETKDHDGISAYSINSLLEKYELDVIDILKIDIEGSEKEIFTTKNSDLSFLKKTKVIAIEIHDEFKCREEIYAILSQYGFTYTEHQESTIGINQNLLQK